MTRPDLLAISDLLQNLHLAVCLLLSEQYSLRRVGNSVNTKPATFSLPGCIASISSLKSIQSPVIKLINRNCKTAFADLNMRYQGLSTSSSFHNFITDWPMLPCIQKWAPLFLQSADFCVCHDLTYSSTEVQDIFLAKASFVFISLLDHNNYLFQH